MRTGVTVSAGLHGAVLVLTMIAWPFSSPLPADQIILPVELLTVADETNIMAQMRAEDAKPDETPAEAPEVKTAAVEPETEPPSELAPTPLDQDVKIPEIAEDAAEPKPETPEPPVKPRPKPPAPPKPRPKEDFNVDSIIGLLDQRQQEQTQEGPTPKPAANDQQLAAVGLASALTLSEMDAFRVQVGRCWNVPVGAPNANELIVLMHIQLRPDGTLMAPPEFVDETRYNSGDAYYRAAADAARRAVIQCQPYTLPPQKYETWREIEMQFDPSMMAGR